MNYMKILLLFYIFSFFNISYTLKCGEEDIENCLECGSGDKANECIKCKDKYFLFFNNLYCIPCNDSLYGQIGCEGNCDATNYLETRNVFCYEDGCKEGFYNLNGICFNCTEGSPGCKICSYTVNQKNEHQYHCSECLNNKYKLNSQGNCKKCDINYCKKCHYDLYNNQVCDQCNEGYYLGSNKTYCKNCKAPIKINNGICTICSDNKDVYESSSCFCDLFYTITNHSTCIKCPDNCPFCEYNNKTNKVECLKCEPGYTLNPEKECTNCGNGCQYCTLSNDLTPVCTTCFSKKFTSKNTCLICPENCKYCDDNEKCTICKHGHILLNNGKCGECPLGCNKCGVKENNDIICLECDEHYALKSEKECVYCPNITREGLLGCSKCGYNKKKQNFECYECQRIQSEHNKKIWKNIYTYVANTFQCFNNTNKYNLSFYGCAIAYKNDSRFECQKCKGYPYIMIKNKKICKGSNQRDLYSCTEAEDIGEIDPKYSCIKCEYNSAKILSGEIFICKSRVDRLSWCLEGIYDTNKHQYNCTKCVPNAHLNSNYLCQPDSDSFCESYWCYKCDDEKKGNVGCLAEKGCSYYSINSQLNCKECKEGYFNYTEGQCYSCSAEIQKCEKCHYDNLKNKLICDKCPYGYTLNLKDKKCELKNCEDYPEISEGCVICDKNREEYILNKKCDKCKIGYFKTRDGQCVNCRTEENGGPDCVKCKYALNEKGVETDNIICDYCPDGSRVLNADGKCFNFIGVLYSDNCEMYEFKLNDDNTKKLVCTICSPGYYLNNDGKCINYLNYMERIQNCYKYTYTFNNITYCASNNYSGFCTYSELHNTYYDIGNEYNEYNYIKSYIEKKDFNIPINYTFKAKCIECDSKYYLDSKGECIEISDEDCSLISIAFDITPKRLSICEKFCNNWENNKIFYEINYYNTIEGKNMIFNPYNFLYDLYYNNYFNYNGDIFHYLNDDLKPIFLKNKLCVDPPKNFKWYDECFKFQYDASTDTYKCIECKGYNNYYLDPKKNICIYINDEGKLNPDDNYNCLAENIGTISEPIFSCTKCYNDNFLLVTNENNIKYCTYKDNEEIRYCSKANANTTYVNTVYNCTDCLNNFLSYNSKFFGRKICQNVFDKIITEKEIYLKKFEEAEYIKASEDGTCIKKNMFSPDGEKCYQCDDQYVGMPGCKGACNFSTKRNDIIICEDGCKTGYIEVNKGICKPCNTANHGCYECHYEDDNYPINYSRIKRQRKFICDFCESSFNKINGKCVTCEELGLDACEECAVDPQNNNGYICTKCLNEYILENGNCNPCYYGINFIKDNKCFSCKDYKNGGIKECFGCEKNINNNVICQICNYGFILLTNNNTCLNIFKNKELEKFKNTCLQLTLDSNNKLYCTKCLKDYILLKDNSNNFKGNCIKILALYDDDFTYRYNFYKYFNHTVYNPFDWSSNIIYDDEYYFYNNYDNYPCQEAINLGTSEKPIYSCIKCYNYFNYSKGFYFNSYFVKVKNERNNVEICVSQDSIYFKNFLRNCSEAINKTKDGIEKYDCLKCIDENNLIYNPDLKINYCVYAHIANKCMIKYCEICKYGNNYFCNKCILSNYEVNRLTGQCVEKSEFIPSITWKDIFRLKMNGQYKKNYIIFYGPSLIIRGITCSRINTRHAFLIYLTFKVKSSLLRNLDSNGKYKEIKIPAICEVINSVEGTSNEVNIIDYECLANNTNNSSFDDYYLDKIEEGENEGLLKKSNLYELSKEILLEDMKKEKAVFTLEDVIKYITFEMNEIKNQTANNFTFDFIIEGKLNKEMNKGIISGKLDLNEIEEKVDFIFSFDDNKKANLTCKLDINKYKNNNIFSFKTSEIKNKNNNIYFSKLDEVLLINGYKEDTEDQEKKNYTGAIIGCTIVGIIIIGGIIAFVIYMRIMIKNKIFINLNKAAKKENTEQFNEKISPFQVDIPSKEKIIKKH